MAQISTNAVEWGLYAILTVTQGYQNIAENYTDLNWEVKVESTNAGWATSDYKENWLKPYINGELVWTGGTGGRYNKGDRWSGTHRVYHNADGSKNVKLFVEARFPSYCAAEGSMWLTKIPRQAEITSAPNFTDDQNPTITYRNVLGNMAQNLDACISFTGQADDIRYRPISKTGNSYTFNLTNEERNVLRQRIGNGREAEVIFFVKTMIDGKEFYSTLKRKVTLAGGLPTISGYLSYNESTRNLPDNKILQNKNNVTITLNGSAYGNKGATIKTLQLKINNKIINNDPSNKVFNVGNIDASGNIRAELTAIDSRGFNSAIKTLDLYIYEYKNPFVKIEATRKNNYEEETSIVISGKIHPININGSEYNAIREIKYSFGGNTYAVSHRSINKDGTFKAPVIYKSIPNTKSEGFKAYLSDKFTTVSNSSSVNKGKPIFRISTYDNKLYNNEKRVVTEDELKSVKKETIWRNDNGVQIVTDSKRDITLYNMPNLSKYISEDSDYVLHLYLQYVNDGIQVFTIGLNTPGPHWVSYTRDLTGSRNDILLLAVAFKNLNTTNWICQLGGNISVDRNRYVENNTVYGGYKLKRVVLEKI